VQFPLDARNQKEWLRPANKGKIKLKQEKIREIK
jgi:hypothetical protein